MATANSLLMAKESAATQGHFTTSLTAGTPVLWLQYLGATDSGATLEVDATTGDLEFTTDGTTADTTIGIPTLDGTIDVSDAAGNTLGEVVDAIKNSANWDCHLLAGIRADLSTNVVQTLAEVDMSTAAMKVSGVFLHSDSAVTFDMGFAISGFAPSSAAAHYDDESCVSYLTYAELNSTYASGTSVIQVYSASQTGESLIFQIDSAATTVNKVLGTNPDTPIIRSKVGERLVVRINSTAMSAATLLVNGKTIDRSGVRYVDGYAITNIA